jgi:hypothetical protein
MMEKPQERKRRANIDGGIGNSKTCNPFSVLSNVEISKVASTVNVDVGKDVVEKMDSLAKIQEIDAGGAQKFSNSCDKCKEINLDSDSGIGQCDGTGELENVDPSTPTSNVLPSLVDEEAEL